jgi:thiamine transport system ATP-binding protein
VSSSSPVLEVEGLSTSWGPVPVLRSVSFTVAEGELLVLLGPNGSGKTTLLRALAGLEPLTAGRVRLDGVDLGGRPPHRRGLPLMFQDAVLFPNRTVYENIAYAPLLQKLPREQVRGEVDRMIELLHLDGFEERKPDQLSGGERQRVALGRTLAARPRLVLLDEPFASIDPELKSELRTEFRRALRAVGTAAIHVTHDRDEGLFLGDRVGLLFDGRLEAVDRPRALFEQPRSARAARFLGYNLLPSARGLLAVHPSDLTIDPSGTGPVVASVVAVGPSGRGTTAVFRTDAGDRIELRAADPMEGLTLGTRAALTWERAVELADEPPMDGADPASALAGAKSPKGPPGNEPRP